MMFRRKLQALEYHCADNIDIKNMEDLRALVIWLEDQKIRHNKIEDRMELRTNTGENWILTFHKYLKDLECPHNVKTELSAAVDWLLGVAVRYDFGDDCQQHHEMNCGLSPMLVNLHPSIQTKSALDISSVNDTLKNGIKALKNIVQVSVCLSDCKLLKKSLFWNFAYDFCIHNSSESFITGWA